MVFPKNFCSVFVLKQNHPLVCFVLFFNSRQISLILISSSHISSLVDMTATTKVMMIPTGMSKKKVIERIIVSTSLTIAIANSPMNKFIKMRIKAKRKDTKLLRILVRINNRVSKGSATADKNILIIMVIMKTPYIGMPIV